MQPSMTLMNHYPDLCARLNAYYAWDAAHTYANDCYDAWCWVGIRQRETGVFDRDALMAAWVRLATARRQARALWAVYLTVSNSPQPA